MDISQWIKTRDYQRGVELYASNPKHNRRVLTNLLKGETQRNMSLLIRVLRQLPEAESKEKPSVAVKVKEKKKIPPEPSKKDVQKTKAKESSTNKYLSGVRYAELPPLLKLRYRKLKDLFYDKCDLKFVLNEIPAGKEAQAMEIQLKIDDIDMQLRAIWRELDHWRDHKSYLPDKPDQDFSNMTPLQLDKKRRSLESSITKKKTRIAKWEEQLEDLQGREAVKMNNQISRTSSGMHQDHLNLLQIRKLLSGDSE